MHTGNQLRWKASQRTTIFNLLWKYVNVHFRFRHSSEKSPIKDKKMSWQEEFWMWEYFYLDVSCAYSLSHVQLCDLMDWSLPGSSVHGILQSRIIAWRALESITTNKASGGDGIPVELFQILKDDAVKLLHSICQQIWKT